MSTIEKFRPALHLSPSTGWMNDPNGLIKVDGIYHAFFQHDPHSTLHGPMHWGHATSTDLAHWTEQSIALYPTDLGTCFSGSAVETQTGDVKLFYTAHDKSANGDDYQTQCLVHADRSLSKFTPEPANPIVTNPGRVVFRDPKVVWHAPTGRWIMLVTEGQTIGFYGSADLMSWSHLSSFGAGHGRHSDDGPWECPDLVPLSGPGGKTAWVLIVGLNPGSYAPGSGTQYFIGQFDGARFTNANSAETELWLDYGRDYYAQTFFDRGGQEPPIAMAWASNWLYARETPTHAFRGSFTLPRELRLIETPAGLRVAASVPKHLADQFDHFRIGDAPLVPRTGTYRLTGTIRLQPGQAAQIALFGEALPQLTFARGADGLVSLRLARTAFNSMRDFAHDYVVPVGVLDELQVEIFVDNGLVELAVDGGKVWATNLHFPAEVAGRVAVTRCALATVTELAWV